MKRLSILLVICSLSIQLFAQQIQEPSKGKALVYFTRTSEAGFLINFKFFDGDQYIGKINGEQYFVYECDPGIHSFWALSENMSMVYADLEADRMYFIDAIAKMGAFKANVELEVLDKSHKKYKKKRSKIVDAILYKQEIILSKDQLEEGQRELKDKIAKGMRYVKAMNTHDMERAIITPDMYIELYPKKN